MPTTRQPHTELGQGKKNGTKLEDSDDSTQFCVEPTRSSRVFIMAASVYDCLANTAISSGSTCSLIRSTKGYGASDRTNLKSDSEYGVTNSTNLKAEEYRVTNRTILKTDTEYDVTNSTSLKTEEYGVTNRTILKTEKEHFFLRKKEKVSQAGPRRVKERQTGKRSSSYPPDYTPYDKCQHAAADRTKQAKRRPLAPEQNDNTGVGGQRRSHPPSPAA